ncbi:MAG: hypothetical protein QOJ46_1905 [bacterium]
MSTSSPPSRSTFAIVASVSELPTQKTAVEGTASELLPRADGSLDLHAALAGESLRAQDHLAAGVRRHDCEAAQRQPDRELVGPGGAVEHRRARRQLGDGCFERLDSALGSEQRVGHEPVVDARQRVVGDDADAGLPVADDRVAAPAVRTGATVEVWRATPRSRCETVARASWSARAPVATNAEMRTR